MGDGVVRIGGGKRALKLDDGGGGAISGLARSLAVDPSRYELSSSMLESIVLNTNAGAVGRNSITDEIRQEQECGNDPVDA